jgi:hypothetical protein
MPGVAVAAFRGGDPWEPVIAAVRLESIDGIVTTVVIREDPGQEDGQGD